MIAITTHSHSKETDALLRHGRASLAKIVDDIAAEINMYAAASRIAEAPTASELARLFAAQQRLAAS